MIQTPNLGLIVWNLSTDPYDSGQLAGNLQKLDDHDHSPGKGPQVPTSGIQDGAITQSKIATGVSLPTASIPNGFITSPMFAAGAVNTAAIGPGAVGAAQVANNALGFGQMQVAFAKDNVEPIFTLPKKIFERAGFFANYASSNLRPLGLGQDVGVGGSAVSLPGAHFRINQPDYVASSRTTNVRVRAIIITNSVAPAITFTTSLYTVTANGASGSLFQNYTGTVGSSAAIASPSSSSTTVVDGAWFAIPATGTYGLAVAPSAGMAAGSIVNVIAELHVQQV